MTRKITNLQYFDGQQWEKIAPQPADHIKTPRAGGIYTHHGIFISDSEVIHFASEDSDNLTGAGNEIINTDLKTFLKGGELFVRIYNNEEQSRLFDKDMIISYARSCVGDAGYNLVFNNCEHFCNKCTLDEHRSKQVEDVILPHKKGDSKMNILDIIEKVNTKTRILVEPSKEAVAQIEKMKAIELAEIDKEKMILSAELEGKLNEFNAKLAQQLIQTQSEEFIKLNKVMLEIAKEAQMIEIEKYNLLENASLEMRSKIESFYKNCDDDINKYEFEFNEKLLPTLLEKLEGYDKNSASYELYKNSIIKYTENFFLRIQSRLKMLNENKCKLIESSDYVKKEILNNSNRIIEKRMQTLDEAIKNSHKLRINFNRENAEHTPKITERKNENPNEIEHTEPGTEKN